VRDHPHRRLLGNGADDTRMRVRGDMLCDQRRQRVFLHHRLRLAPLRARLEFGGVVPPVTGPASLDELREVVEHMHGVPARYVETVEVDERFKDEVVWQGAVEVFDLTGHPSGAKRSLGVELPHRGHAPEVQSRVGGSPGRRARHSWPSGRASWRR